MDSKKIGTKATKASSYGAIGVLVEWVVNEKLKLGAPAGVITAAAAAAGHALHEAWLQWRRK